MTTRALNARRDGFTLIELVVSMSVLALLAGVAVASLSGLATSRQNVAASRIRTTLIYAQEWAMGSANDTWVTFDVSNDLVSVFVEDPANPGKASRLTMTDPLTRAAMTLQLGTDGVGITSASIGIDDTSKVSTKTTTTVAMDFGRITIDNDLILYLFGTPGQDRFSFMWDDLAAGSLGAIVLADSRRLTDAFYGVDYFESAGIPFVVAVNRFDGIAQHSLEDIKAALQLDDKSPVVYCDARDRSSVKDVLLVMLDVVVKRMHAQKQRTQ